jgi:hypothetical protein
MDELTGTALHDAHHPFMILSCKDAGQDHLDRNSDRPIRHILFLCCQDVRIGCNHPTNIRGVGVSVGLRMWSMSGIISSGVFNVWRVMASRMM